MKIHTTHLLVTWGSHPRPCTCKPIPNHDRCGFRDIFHVALLHIIHAISDDKPHLRRADTQVNSTNDTDEEHSLTVHPIRTKAGSNAMMDAIFDIKQKSDSDFPVIHHIVQLSSYTRTSEDDSKSLIGAFIIVTSTSPAFPSILSYYLLANYETFIPPFLCPFHLSFISPIIDLEHHYLHQLYPPVVVVDHQQSAPFYPTRHFAMSLRPVYRFDISSLNSSILNHIDTPESLRVSAQDSDSTFGVVVGTSEIITTTETNYSTNENLLRSVVQ